MQLLALLCEFWAVDTYLVDVWKTLSMLKQACDTPEIKLQQIIAQN